MKKSIILTLLIALTGATALVYNCSAARGNTTEADLSGEYYAYSTGSRTGKDTKIQVAILLDTSSSMDGLIEQAKSRLWNIVNTLTTLKYKGGTPRIEIALYEYGNNGIRTDDYIRQVTPLTTDLDLISEKLFALTTWGGYEYCGAAIDKAVRQLYWSRGDADMKLIYIAGNEPFTQGGVSYKSAISNALENNIYVNTIHCGGERDGVNGMWRDGAVRGRGKAFNIDHNARVHHVDTPYDARISECNSRLNATYIGYGVAGYAKKQSQAVQDMNAESISPANMAERAVTKSKSAYRNSEWDLVDLAAEDEKAFESIDKKELPAELQEYSTEELKAEVKKKEKERETIRKEIETLSKQRQEYIDKQLKKSGTDGDDLGRAIASSIIELAEVNGYSVSGK